MDDVFHGQGGFLQQFGGARHAAKLNLLEYTPAGRCPESAVQGASGNAKPLRDGGDIHDIVAEIPDEFDGGLDQCIVHFIKAAREAAVMIPEEVCQ